MYGKKLTQSNYIYLLREREFVRSDENVYKIGRTSQDPGKRFASYPKDSEILLVKSTDNCKEKETALLSIFRTKYTPRKDIGAEYFQGNVNDMIKTIETALVERKVIRCEFCRITIPSRFAGAQFCCGNIYHYHCIDQIRKCTTCKKECTPLKLYITDIRLTTMFRISNMVQHTDTLEDADVVAVFGDKSNGSSVNQAYRSLMMKKLTYLFIDPFYSKTDRMFFYELNEMCAETIKEDVFYHIFHCFRLVRIENNQATVRDTVLIYEPYLETATTWNELTEVYDDDIFKAI